MSNNSTQLNDTIKSIIKNMSDCPTTIKQLNPFFTEQIKFGETYTTAYSKMIRESALKNWSDDTIKLAHALLSAMFKKNDMNNEMIR